MNPDGRTGARAGFGVRALPGALLLLFLLAAPLRAHPPRATDNATATAEQDRRLEMMADRLAGDLKLSRDQRQELKVLLENTAAAAKPIQDELRANRRQIKEAVKAGKSAAELAPLHESMGKAHARLSSVQTVAFSEALRWLKPDQRTEADVLFDVLGMVVSTAGRGLPPMPFRMPGTNGPPAAPGTAGAKPQESRSGDR